MAASPTRRETGAALVETAISIPFLIILLFWMLAAGQLFAQVGWLVRTSYESVLSGSETVPFVGIGQMFKIKQYFNDSLNRSMPIVNLTPEYFDDTEADGDVASLIRVRLSGDLSPVMTLGVLDIGVELIGPHVGKDLGLPSESGFQVVDGPYDCSGDPCGAGTQPACPTSPC